jgi:hypothetical protein
MKKRLLLTTVAYMALMSNAATAFDQVLGDSGIDVDMDAINELIASGGVIDIADFNDISQVGINIANAIGTSGTGFNPVIVANGVSVDQSIDSGSAGVIFMDFTSVALVAENVINLGEDDGLEAGTLIIDEVSQIAANSLNVAGLSYEGAAASFSVSQIIDLDDGEDVYMEASNIIVGTAEDGSTFIGSDDADVASTVDVDESANEVQAALNRLNALSLSSTTGEPVITLNQLADMAFSDTGGVSGGATAEFISSNIIVAGSFIDGPIVTPPGQTPIIYDPSVLGTDQIAQATINTVSISATSGAAIIDQADVSGGTLELPPGYVIGGGDFTGELGYDDTPNQYVNGFASGSGGGINYAEIEVSNVIVAATLSTSGPIDDIYESGGVDYSNEFPSGGTDGGIGDVVVGDLAQTGVISLNTISAQGIEAADNVDLTLGQDEVFIVTTSGGTDTVVGYLGVDQVAENLVITEDIGGDGGDVVNENYIGLYTLNGDVTLYEVDQTRAVSVNTLSTDGALIGGFDTNEAAEETEFTQVLDDVVIDVDNTVLVESENLGDGTVTDLSQTNVGTYNSVRAGEFSDLNLEQTATAVDLGDNDNDINISVDEGFLNVGNISQINSQSVNSASATDYEGDGFVGDTLNTGPSVSQSATDVQLNAVTNDFDMNQDSGAGDVTLDGLSQTVILSVNTLQGSFETINVSQSAININMESNNYAEITYAGGSLDVDGISQTALNRINAITATPVPVPSVD